MTEPKTQTLDVAGAVLRYDTRDAEAESSGGEFGMTGDPDGFAATLRQVLTEDG